MPRGFVSNNLKIIVFISFYIIINHRENRFQSFNTCSGLKGRQFSLLAKLGRRMVAPIFVKYKPRS